MAIGDLGMLQNELPQLFEKREKPPWDDNWIAVPVDDPESLEPSALDGGDDLGSALWDEDDSSDPWETWGRPEHDWEGPIFEVAFPGSLRSPNDPALGLDGVGGAHQPLPPDCLAFYLPFHSYYPDWWGVYLIAEGVRDLASYLNWWTNRMSGRQLGRDLAVAVARHFLYRHESFHHSVECFATRLEVVERTSLYRTAFDRLYRKTFGTDGCIEEALANAYAIQGIRKATKAHPLANDIRVAVEEYVRQSPPGYRHGVKFAGGTEFKRERARFAELNHNASFQNRQKTGGLIWQVVPHSFAGISRITSRVNYLVNRNSSLGVRLRVDARFISCRKFTRRLQKLGCSFVRSGKGSHEIWEGPSRHRTTVPRHVGDLHSGLARDILKQLGLTLTWDEFMAG